jgi:hypothetical protein
VTLTLTRTRPPIPAAVRKNVPGHYLTMGASDARRGNYYKTVSAQPNLLTLPGVNGIQLRYKWSDLETAEGQYNFGVSGPGPYPDSERTIRAELWRCAQAGSRLIIMVVDRTFDGTHAVPVYMQGNDQYERLVTTNVGPGYSTIRWNAYVQTRFRALIRAMGNAFDQNPRWYGIAFQETSTGLTSTDRTQTGYSDVPGGANNYADALIANLKEASDHFPTSRTFFYQNYFPTVPTDYRIDEVVDALEGYNGGPTANGVILCGPDILPDNPELVARVYPRFMAPPVGHWGQIPLANSMQFDSYDHVHTTASPPDTRVPGETWAIGDYWTPLQLFKYGRDTMHLNYVMSEHDQGGAGYHWETDMQAVIAANPTFNT